jgi:hypothetical protein
VAGRAGGRDNLTRARLTHPDPNVMVRESRIPKTEQDQRGTPNAKDRRMNNANTVPETFKITRKTVWKCVPCDGEAHSPEAGGNVDHCGRCAPMWAEIPIPEIFPSLDAWRQWLLTGDPSDRKHARRAQEKAGDRIVAARHEAAFRPVPSCWATGKTPE